MMNSGTMQGRSFLVLVSGYVIHTTCRMTMTTDRTVDLGPTILYGTRRSRDYDNVLFFEAPMHPIMYLMHPGRSSPRHLPSPISPYRDHTSHGFCNFPPDTFTPFTPCEAPIRDSPTLLPRRFTRHDSHPGTQIPPGNPSERILTWVPAAGIVYRGAALFRLLSQRIGARRRVPDSSDLQGGPRLHSTLNRSHLDGSGEHHPSPAARGLCPY
jgi:hypothetical protein